MRSSSNSSSSSSSIQLAAAGVLYVGLLCNGGSNNRCRVGECNRLAINRRQLSKILASSSLAAELMSGRC
jgi:hypothetical protein